MQALRNGTLTMGAGPRTDGTTPVRRTEVGEALAQTAQEVEATEEPLGS
jgi:hypothetical protein